ncbi:protein swallow [Teleopsis dalmanni]|uniref:protein swallow n=1 Tax=Teleopsis dalmanni TaxID=139649 RepID=UPI000D32A13D|nr:protein swallow [Teleopsis dalmanni]
MLQDESFPHDEILAETTFMQNVQLIDKSTNERPTSALSSNSAKSDPTGLAENTPANQNCGQNKAVSYNDVHSAYTKRRYKHVTSKVREYINNLKTEDQTRQNLNKLKRHCSVPETSVLLDATTQIAAATGTRGGIMSYSAGELHKSDESNLRITHSLETSTGIASGSRPSSSEGQHDSSDDAAIDRNYTDYLTSENERLQSYNEYQRTKLHEKNGEIIRLRQSVDFLRFELNKCEDKLRKRDDRLGSKGALHTLIQQSLHTIPLYDYTDTKSNKAIQTDFMVPHTPQNTPISILITPDTPDTSRNTNETLDENDNVCLENVNPNRKRKRRYLRRRWLQLFIPCTRCNNPNQSEDSIIQQTFAQIPLLEKSFEPCGNMR